MKYLELLQRYRKGLYVPPERLLCLDPGFTTGVAVFENGELSSWEQVTTIVQHTNGTTIKWADLVSLLIRVQPTLVVCENYRIYEHKLDQHSNSSVDTLRLIGGIDLLCSQGWDAFAPPVPIVYQMATQAKGFCTDDKLKEWGYWQKGMRHSRDAIRHGCYYMLFNKEEE